MKKILFRSVLAFLAVVALASCKKDYTCTCTSTVADPLGGADIVTTSSTTINGKKSDVESACDAGDISVMGSTVDCEIVD